MNWTVGRKIAGGFGLALLVFMVVGFASWRSTVQLIHAADVRRDTDERADMLDDARLAMRGVGITLRTYLISGEDAHLEAFKASQKTLTEPVERLRLMMGSSPTQGPRAEKLGQMVAQYQDAVSTMAELRRTKGLQAATQMFLADSTRELLAETGKIIVDMQREQDQLSKQRTADAENEMKRTQLTVVVGNLLGLALALLAGVLITRNIAGPLSQLMASTEKITAGEINADIPHQERTDEIGALARAQARMATSLLGMAQTAEQIAMGDLRVKVSPQSEQDMLGLAFARMSSNLRGQIVELVDGANVLAAAASEIVASSSQLAASATQSAAAVSETTTTVEEVRQTAHMANQKARLVSETSSRAVQTSEIGRKSTQELEAGMVRIRRQMEAIASSMAQMSEQSQAVGQIIATVEDLATQSNLLAVNAAIEAAKAGDYGKGFGVVAQEVKSLAEQSRQATTQVRDILRDIQRATNAAMLATEEGGKVVDVGTRQSEAAGGVIQDLRTSVGEAAQAALQIAASSQQQLVGMDQVAGAMDSINQASVQNVSSATQLEATARGIQELGERMRHIVERYKV